MAGKLASGSLVRIGLVLKNGNNGHFYTDDGILSEVIPTLEGCLYDTGQFENLEFDYQDGGYFSNDYLNIKAITADDFAKAEDFGGLVLQTFQLCEPGVFQTIVRQDPVIIDYVPQDVEGKSGVQQVNAVDSIPKGDAPKPPGRCDRLSGIEYVACQAGVNTDTVKYGGVFLGLGALFLLLVVAKK